MHLRGYGLGRAVSHCTCAARRLAFACERILQARDVHALGVIAPCFPENGFAVPHLHVRRCPSHAATALQHRLVPFAPAAEKSDYAKRAATLPLLLDKSA